MSDYYDSMIEVILEAAITLVLLSRKRRRYIDEAHVPYLDTRFRMFDSYLASKSPESFYRYVRLYPNEFEALHDRLAGRLSHSGSHRAPISSRQRLCLFLRFIAHGTSYSHMSGEYGIGVSTMCTIAQEVAQAIIEELHDSAFPTPTAQTWATAVKEFAEQWDYPAAMGALDGKHIACVCPSNTGSRYYNYKGFYSVVLLALVDANYKCLIYDLGASGRSSDAGIFMTSGMKTFLEERDEDFPGPIQLANVGKVPSHFLVDQGFRLTTRFMRPYSSSVTDRKAVYFNYKLSRARRVVENYFGMLASRFRLLLRPIYATPENVKAITLAIMILHNLLVDSIGGEAVVRRYGVSEIFQDQRDLGVVGNVPSDAKAVRETMKAYFCHRDNVR